MEESTPQEFTPEEAKAALGNATFLQEQILPQAPMEEGMDGPMESPEAGMEGSQSPEMAPEAPEEPEVDMGSRLDEMEAKFMERLDKLEKKLTPEPDDKEKEIDSIRQELEELKNEE